MIRALFAVSLIVIVAALLYGIFAWQRAEAPAPVIETEEAAPEVTFSRSYDEGVLEVEGTVMAPDACSTLESAIVAAGGAVRVDLTLTEDEGICLERPTELSFSLSVETLQEAPVRVFLNGEEVAEPHD